MGTRDRLSPPFDTDPDVLAANGDIHRCFTVLFREAARVFCEAPRHPAQRTIFGVAADLRYTALDDCMDYDTSPEEAWARWWFGNPGGAYWKDDEHEAAVLGFLLLAEFLDNPPEVPLRDLYRVPDEKVVTAPLEDVVWMLVNRPIRLSKEGRRLAVARICDTEGETESWWNAKCATST